MAEQTNWLRRPARRRTVLRAGALGGAATAFLAACGGDDGNEASGGGDAPNSALLTAVAKTATAKQPKLGGTLTSQLPTAPPTLDPYTQTSFVNAFVNHLSYSKLYKSATSVPEVNPGDLTMIPDLAQKLPEQSDPTTLTMKLKPAKWHNVPPVNGRELTSEDARYAIERYQNLDKSVWKSTWAWVDKVETPDKQTVTLKLKYPYADAVQIMGGNTGAFLSPREIAESSEAATKIVGSGPFIFEEYQTGVSVKYRKNPEFYDAPIPYIDAFTYFITTDQAKRAADFSAKSVDLTYVFLADERDQVRKNRPDARSEEQQGIGGYLYMRTDKPPFNDKRVRQALSMGINRKAIRDALTKGEGQPDQAVFIGLEGWAKPVKDLPGAKYWEYNPAEAKALLAAAGVTNLTFDWFHADSSVYGQQYVDQATLIQAQWKQSGITANDKQQPYAQYISTTYQGNYEGMGHSPRAVPYFLDGLTEQLYWSSTGRTRINLSYVNDPRLNALLDKQRSQYEVAERKKTMNEIQDLISEEQWQIYGSTNTLSLFWNADVENYRGSSLYPYNNPIRAWKERA